MVAPGGIGTPSRPTVRDYSFLALAHVVRIAILQLIELGA